MHAERNTKVRKLCAAFPTGDDQLTALEFKKRKVAHSGTLPLGGGKSSKRFTPIQGGRPWTISIAVPGSILNKYVHHPSPTTHPFRLPWSLTHILSNKSLPTAEQRLATVARIARSLAIFCVDEVIVYDDAPSVRNTIMRLDGPGGAPGADTYTGDSDPCHFVAQVLSFLECPPFMRRRLFPLHPNLKHTALLPAVDMPHHPGPKDPWLPYIEGVTVPAEEAAGAGEDASKSVSGTLVDTGPGGVVQVADVIPPNTRVTLHFDSPDAQHPACTHPDAPRTRGGYYWGYSVRASPSLSGVFTECPFEGGYDLSVGTSERGTPLSQAMAEHCEKQRQQRQSQQRQSQQRQSHRQYGHAQSRRGGGGGGGGGGYGSYYGEEQHAEDEAHGDAPSFQHLLVVFGGPRGIELAAANDPNLAGMGIRGAKTRELRCPLR
ncbi:hypothetical protein PWT90_10423 [Aphanocladium album]|nr:hypothetical protein PWT90_10423 [Aphanocladium album]